MLVNQIQNGTMVHGYLLTKKLGEGGSGIVFEGVECSSRRIVAIKFFPIKHKNTFSKESFYLQALASSKNIVNIIDKFTWEQFSVIVMEKLVMDLLDYIEIATIDIDDGKKILQQICLGLKALHNSNMAHRDIKPENILLNYVDCVKLADLGCCISFDEQKLVSSSGIFGTCFYSAPEISTSDFYDPTSADIWSLGVVLHILFTGVWPYLVDDNAELVTSISNGTATLCIFDHLLPEDDSLLQLIKSMLNKNPESRPTAEQILNSQFLLDITDSSNQEIESKRNNQKMKRLPKLINFLQSKLRR